MTRLAAIVLMIGFGLAWHRPARACTPINDARLFAARASGPQPRNSGVIGVTSGYGAPSFLAFDEAGKAVTIGIKPLRSFDASQGISLVTEVPAPAAGSRRVYRGAPRDGLPATAELTLEFGEEMDTTPPGLQGPIRLWVDRGQSVGVCPGVPEYVTGVLLPVASERGYVSIFETDRDGRNEQPLADVFVQPEMAARELRLGITGEVGRTICLAFRTTDLAGNSTPLGAPCCADERGATGACERVAPPPRLFGPPTPDGGTGDGDAGPGVGPGPSAGGGGGCSLSPRSRASAAWIWVAIVFGWVVRARRHRRLARPVAIAVAALLLIGCEEEGGSVPGGDAGADAAPDAASAAQAPLQPIWGADSQRLEIACSAVFGGSMRFAANRDQMTDSQLTVVARLGIRPKRSGEVCVFDAVSCQVDVVAADGGRSTFHGPHETECDVTRKLIPWASLSSVLEAVDCQIMERGHPLRPNPYCQHGLRPAADDPLVHVAEPGAYALELSTCGKPDPTSPPQIQVLDRTGAVVLQTRTPPDAAPGTVCVLAQHRFAQPGLYQLKISGVANEGFERPTLRFIRVHE